MSSGFKPLYLIVVQNIGKRSSLVNLCSQQKCCSEETTMMLIRVETREKEEMQVTLKKKGSHWRKKFGLRSEMIFFVDNFFYHYG